MWAAVRRSTRNDPHRLAEELRAVRSHGARITWFHPSDNPPASQAMQACTPLIERFIRLNRLRDLASAAEVLQ